MYKCSFLDSELYCQQKKGLAKIIRDIPDILSSAAFQKFYPQKEHLKYTKERSVDLSRIVRIDAQDVNREILAVNSL